MIVPRLRLLFWTGALAVPLAFAAAGPPASTVAEGAFLAFLLIAAGDALAARGRLRDLGASLPALVRLSVDRPGAVQVTLVNASLRSRSVLVGLALPGGIETERDVMPIDLPAETRSSRVEWRCTGRRRGRFTVPGVRFADVSPLGFWEVRRAVAAPAEIRVYPNLLAEGRGLAALFARRAAFGLHAHRQVGKGREFEKLRDYIPGDDYEDVHWRATAKRGRPVTKVFQIERTQEIYVVLDGSRLSARVSGEPPRPALDRFVTAALMLALAAERQGDLFGLVTFGDRVRSFLRARRGAAHFDACREALYTLEPQIVAPDFAETAAFLCQRLRRRALLLFLTDLDDPTLAEGFVQALRLLSRRHLVLVGMLRPLAAGPLFSAPDVRVPDDLYRALAGHVVWMNLQELGRVLKARGATFFLLEREALCADLVTRYVDVKRRQVL